MTTKVNTSTTCVDRAAWWQSVTRQLAVRVAVLSMLATSIALSEGASAATLTVSNTNDKGKGSLRAAIDNATSGDVIVFAPTINGQTIILTSDQITIKSSVDIQGPGASLLTISGNDVNRIFDIDAGLTVTIAGLTVSHGWANGGGAGIRNTGSVLNLAHDVLSLNHCFHTASAAKNILGYGAAVRVVQNAQLVANDCTFSSNQVDGTLPDGAAGAGAIFVDDTASASVIRCSFIGNSAHGVSGANDQNWEFFAQAEGGAIHNDGSLCVVDCTFVGNCAFGGSNNTSPQAYLAFSSGGAIHNDGQLRVYGSTFIANQSTGGSFGTGTRALSDIGGGYGGAIGNTADATIADCSFTGNSATGGQGSTSAARTQFVGVGVGGAVYSIFDGATVNISECNFTGNFATGGSGNTGGSYTDTGIGGAFANILGASATVMGSTFIGNQATGGMGAANASGGDGLGGGVVNLLGSSITVQLCIVTSNAAIGGSGGTGRRQANGFGGGFYLTADGVAYSDLFTSTNTSGNAASTAFNDIFGTFTIGP